MVDLVTDIQAMARVDGKSSSKENHTAWVRLRTLRRLNARCKGNLFGNNNQLLNLKNSSTHITPKMAHLHPQFVAAVRFRCGNAFACIPHNNIPGDKTPAAKDAHSTELWNLPHLQRETRSILPVLGASFIATKRQSGARYLVKAHKIRQHALRFFSASSHRRAEACRCHISLFGKYLFHDARTQRLPVLRCV